jgi:hypothetical protein
VTETAAAKTTPAPAPTLEQLTARWAQAKNAEEMAKREAENLREGILASFPEAAAAIGYADESVEIGSTSRLDGEALERGLKKLGLLKRAQETSVSTEKVRALAKLEPEVQVLVERCTTKVPRFERAAKKA